jgi:type IV pilus assembly protein PilC
MVGWALLAEAIVALILLAGPANLASINVETVQVGHCNLAMGRSMLFSSRVSLKNMVSLCQAFRVGHEAGLSIASIFEKQAKRGPLAARPVLSRIAEKLQQGEALEDVLRTDGSAFPPLFNTMVAVGERTGNLPEIFRELERYYREQLTLRRQFIQQISWPVFEFFAAILAITMMILIIGWLATPGQPTFDPLGFGVGVPGAIKFLSFVGLFFAVVIGIYFFATRVLGQQATVHRLILSVPVIGPCWQAIILARLSLAFRLTLDSSLPVHSALKRSLAASGNGAYAACADTIATQVKGGDEVTEAFSNCGLFPEEFLQAVHSGEESGQLPEVMARQSAHYQEEASLRLQLLNRFASIGVWLVIAILIIWAIFRMVFSYLNVLNAAGSTDLSQPLF